MKNSMPVPHKIKNRSTVLFCNPISGYTFKGTKIVTVKGYLHSRVHFIIIHNRYRSNLSIC